MAVLVEGAVSYERGTHVHVHLARPWDSARADGVGLKAPPRQKSRVVSNLCKRLVTVENLEWGPGFGLR